MVVPPSLLDERSGDGLSLRSRRLRNTGGRSRPFDQQQRARQENGRHEQIGSTHNITSVYVFGHRCVSLREEARGVFAPWPNKLAGAFVSNTSDA
jgi:hypothetical protein